MVYYLNYNETSREAKWALKHYDEISFEKITVKKGRFANIEIRDEMISEQSTYLQNNETDAFFDFFKSLRYRIKTQNCGSSNSF